VSEGAAPKTGLPLWAKLAIALVIIGGISAAFVFLPLREWIQTFVAWVQDLGAVGVVVFALAYVVAAIFMLPGSILTLAAGFAYGLGWGVLLVSPVSVLGASAAFLIGRHFFRDRIERMVEERKLLRAVDKAIEKKGSLTVMLLRLSPLMPYSLANYAFSVTKIGFGKFVLMSWVGMIPGTFLYVYIGSTLTALGGTAGGAGAEDTSTLETVLFWAGLAATLAVVVMISRTAKRALHDEGLDGDVATSDEHTSSQQVTAS
jgi:uncharacterized membrane protein YdjX (TVP38/TMEM64 family)